LSCWAEVSEPFRQSEVFHNKEMLVHETGSFNPSLGSRLARGSQENLAGAWHSGAAPRKPVGLQASMSCRFVAFCHKL
jgi:hypothetical protein